MTSTMNRLWRLIVLLLLLVPAVSLQAQEEEDSTRSSLHFPIPTDGSSPQSPLYLNNPPNMTTTVEYDPNTHSYVKITKIGSIVVSRQFMTFEEYQDYQNHS